MSSARALLHKASTKVLVLDGISGSVDMEMEQLMFQIIRNHSKDATVVAVTHRLHCIWDDDKILIMKEGGLVKARAPTGFLLVLVCSKHSGTSSYALFDN